MEVKAKSKALADLKAYLETERERLRQEIASSDASTTQERAGYSNHIAENATAVFEQARNVGLRRTHELLLSDVESALKRFSKGTYGTCEHCGNAIDKARLKALPSASLCLSCQTHLENR